MYDPYDPKTEKNSTFRQHFLKCYYLKGKASNFIFFSVSRPRFLSQSRREVVCRRQLLGDQEMVGRPRLSLRSNPAAQGSISLYTRRKLVTV